jgi:hypothetical protein
MNYFKYVLVIIVAFLLSFLDISFFSFLDIYGATVLSSFIFLIIFTIVDKTKQDYLVVSLALVLFFIVLSSLPLIPLLINFFLIPAIINYVRKYYLREPTLFASIGYFFIACFIFELTLLIYARAWNATGFLTFAWFIFLNVFLSFISYAIYLKIRKNFSSLEIKL